MQQHNYSVELVAPASRRPLYSSFLLHPTHNLSLLRDSFVYEYDFGDSWEHEIVVEKALPVEEGVLYPRCLAGKRACPPEDVGGVWGYGDLLMAIKDPTHPEHREMLDRVDEDFDPAAFDPADGNRRFLGLSRQVE